VADDWVVAIADDVVAEAERRGLIGRTIVCASGVSPSGPIHLGNLREVMVPHLVAEELRARGIDCDHILSWDDFDRLRKVPAGVAESFADHIGRPLSRVPDPWGELASYAERFKEPFRAALRALGIPLREISQTEAYTGGAYNESIVLAMERREAIRDTLLQYRTLEREDHDESESGYYPFRVYCEACGTDQTAIQAWRGGPATIAYSCHHCGHRGDFSLHDKVPGKLVWKADWPMRWAHESVMFESGGVDHSSHGSSFTVGAELVRKVFGALPPHYVGYSFVGTSGQAKMSGSAGGGFLPEDALRILEPAVLRWLYARRRPNQAITVDFGAEVLRTYDEWDTLARRVADGTATPFESATHRRSAATSLGALPATPRPMSFRLLSSVVDLTQGAPVQLVRVLRDSGGAATAAVTLEDVEPRLTCAANWVERHMPAEDRTVVRAEPAMERLASLSGDERGALDLLLDGLDGSWTLEGLTELVYAIPKLQRGLPADARPSAEVKAAQRAFFVLLYQLLVGRDAGPRLPTLVLSLGAARVRELLGGRPAAASR